VPAKDKIKMKFFFEIIGRLEVFFKDLKLNTPEEYRARKTGKEMHLCFPQKVPFYQKKISILFGASFPFLSLFLSPLLS
jgi:hypothetical protein